MNIIKILKIRKMNKTMQNDNYQSKRTRCCESCKFCFEKDVIAGYTSFTCLLKEHSFESDNIFNNICKNYTPCRKFKKYLDKINKK